MGQRAAPTQLRLGERAIAHGRGAAAQLALDIPAPPPPPAAPPCCPYCGRDRGGVPARLERIAIALLDLVAARLSGVNVR